MNDKSGIKEFSLPQQELSQLEFWQKINLDQKVKDKPGIPFSFMDGPPFATGVPHHGHLLASVIKDIIPRYMTQTGHSVNRRFGWDCHGIPIEHEIEKMHGNAEKLGVEKFEQECRKIVSKYTNEWRTTITRLGRMVDFDNDYKTMYPDFMESVWWAFKQLWQKNLIYKGTKVVPFSTALGTGLSNFEASSNYQDIQDPSITVLFKIKNQNNYLAIWTTTPWTLPSNLGICINPELEYVLVHDSTKNISMYIAKARLEFYNKNNNLEVLDTITGKELVNINYEPIFPYFKHLNSKKIFKVYCDEYVNTSNGTGLVHMAPAFGEDDARIMDVDVHVCPVNDSGNFTDEVSDFMGLHVKDADKKIIKYLKEKNFLYHQDVIVHSYPMCPRSDQPLIYKAIPAWYVAVTKIKKQLIENNQKTYWIPEHIKNNRFGKWLEGARDWSISRNRVWGTPIPLWENDVTGNIICIGSKSELEILTNTKIDDLHRSYIDHLTFKKKDEPGIYHRVTGVLDCWFESGSMPYAQNHYPFENKDLFEKSFPANFIAEGLDQTRGWFYTLLVLATAIFNKPAFLNVIVNGLVLAADGKKMSKRLKNYTKPDELLTKYGADPLRLYLINSGWVKAEEQRFIDEGVIEMVRKTLLPWLNAYKFFHTYAEIDGWQLSNNYVESNQILDQWILSRLQSLKQDIKVHMQAYKLYNVVPELLKFIEDLTNIYIRLNRPRFWTSNLDHDKCSAYSTLFVVLKEFSTCMAPFTPFLSEYIFQGLKAFDAEENNISVHLTDYPVATTSLIKKNLESAVLRLQQIFIMGRQKRNELKIKTKIPLQSLTIIHKDRNLLEEIDKLSSIIKQELNIKELLYCMEESKYIKLYTKANAKSLGQKFKGKFVQLKSEIENLSENKILNLELNGKISILDETIFLDDVIILREPRSEIINNNQNNHLISNKLISIILDAELNDDLIDEGLAREIVNRIQKTRKDLDFFVNDRIKIQIQSEDKLIRAINKHQKYIERETLAETITISNSFDDKFDAHFSDSIDGHKIAFNLQVYIQS